VSALTLHQENSARSHSTPKMCPDLPNAHRLLASSQLFLKLRRQLCSRFLISRQPLDCLLKSCTLILAMSQFLLQRNLLLLKQGSATSEQGYSRKGKFCKSFAKGKACKIHWVAPCAIGSLKTAQIFHPTNLLRALSRHKYFSGEGAAQAGASAQVGWGESPFL
jgi:hypothetical protein